MRTVFSRSFPLSILLLVSFLAAGQGCNPPSSERSDWQPQPGGNTGVVTAKDRYVLTVIRSVTGPTLIRTDTSTCRMWQMRLNKEGWEAISPETRAPGEGLPVEPGRYLVSSVRSKYGPMLLCSDVTKGFVYRMPMSGEGGWKQIKEPENYLGKLDRVPVSRQSTEDSETFDETEAPDESEASTGSQADADVTLMRETIQDPELPQEMRVFAATQLADISSEKTLPALVEALGAQDPAVVVAAVWALGLNGDPEAIPELTKLLSHEDEEVRDAAQQVLETLRK